MPRPKKEPKATPYLRGSLSRWMILHVASEQFHRKGYDRTSLDDVAKALSVTKPTLYYHFDNKEDILLSCVTEACDRLDAGLSVADSLTFTGRRRLEIFLREYLSVISDNFGVSLVLGDDRVMSESGRAEYHSRRRRINDHVTDIVGQGMRDGSLEVADVTLTVYAIFGMFNWVTRWKSTRPKSSSEDFSRPKSSVEDSPRPKSSSEDFSRPKSSVEDIYQRFSSILFSGIGTRPGAGEGTRRQGP